MIMKVRSRPSSKKNYILKVILISCLIILLGWTMPKMFSVAATAVGYPFHVVNYWLENSSSLIPTFIRDRQDLEAEINSLEDKLVVEKRSDVTQQRLYEENVRLRQLLGVADDVRVAAAVIGRPVDLPYDLLQIDQGSDNGIEVGAPVFVGSDIVVGLVVHTAPQYAFVELFTTPGFEASAFISGPNVVAAIEGVGGGVARVRVPQGIPIVAGNLVFLPSIDPGVFGRISYVESEPTQPEQYGYISPDTAISGIHTVAVGQVSQISQSVEVIDVRIQDLLRTQLKIEGLSREVSTTTATSTESTSTSTSTTP